MTRLQACFAVLALVVAAGCGSTPTPDAANESDGGATPGPVVLDVTIIDGEVTPRGARIELKVGQPLTLSVRSDMAEEVHVHTDPEREFAIKANSHRRFTFTVDEPGRVAIEVHHLDAVIAEVLARK